ncbi:hypothetical protein FC20_GL000378 [Lactobacillus equicursoris DSM 19284 = JCM 14600 = CIP 110162]|uniref:Uncharacterized protein n=1 Tax=Lactobacillus equicursoris DSM 19284 = JCM 14600 = CIP 110162 TaxID=1293597 RepID=A0A0R1M2K2_9LACO|nr:hypothetical protein FC20_GL000378 [Lactobacillus equicursoris DSM 19284 = JCM 14600 = CIP 110162]
MSFCLSAEAALLDDDDDLEQAVREKRDAIAKLLIANLLNFIFLPQNTNWLKQNEPVKILIYRDLLDVA